MSGGRIYNIFFRKNIIGYETKKNRIALTKKKIGLLFKVGCSDAGPISDASLIMGASLMLGESLITGESLVTG